MVEAFLICFLGMYVALDLITAIFFKRCLFPGLKCPTCRKQQSQENG